MKVLLFHCVFDGVAEDESHTRQELAQNANLFIIEVCAFTFAGRFVRLLLVIYFHAQIVFGYVISLIEKCITDFCGEVNFYIFAVNVLDGQLSKFDVHNYSCFWSADDSAGVVCLKLLIALISATTLATSSSVGRSL